MGDTDGSSKAAQGALGKDHKDHTDHSNQIAIRATASVPALVPVADAAGKAAAAETTEVRPGFLARIIGAFNPPETDAADSAAQNRPHGMMNLRRMRVDDVMIPKADITAVSVTSTMDELVDVFKESGMTRLPVFEGTLDTPVGMAHLKDLALQYGFNGKPKDFDLVEMLRPLVYVPPSMTIGVLLTKMQAERRHMALVIDEYGGVDGLVTIEDLIEQVIGQIEDEHDVDEGVYWSEEKAGPVSRAGKNAAYRFREGSGPVDSPITTMWTRKRSRRSAVSSSCCRDACLRAAKSSCIPTGRSSRSWTRTRAGSSVCVCG